MQNKNGNKTAVSYVESRNSAFLQKSNPSPKYTKMAQVVLATLTNMQTFFTISLIGVSQFFPGNRLPAEP
jgi:hypothetical protein